MKRNYSPKPLFLKRMQALLSDKKDFENYLKSLEIPPARSIRCNTLKISPYELKKRLEQKGWKISQPWKKYPEVMIIRGKLPTHSHSQINNNSNKEKVNNSDDKISSAKDINKFANEVSNFLGEEEWESLEPGELGRSLEHQLGYYYVQDLASMLPSITLIPEENEKILDLAAAPGSKTTQIASKMKNTGLVIANEVSLGRIKILASNLERCGVTNCIITKKEGSALCKRLERQNFKFDRILIDAPCSGEGTLNSNSKTALMWNIKTVKNLPRIQKNLISSVINILKIGGELVYSTCTHAPEENEGVIDFILKKFPEMKIQKLVLPKELKFREGIINWGKQEYSNEVKHSVRIYPQDNNTEGFFIAKFTKIK